ncbi:MAG TPA: hypothetical protein VM582_10150, partial [Candidatus Thermoplasmatota archaeon]|nr:hypothetical protein [Candidatus Thermoplasmatota archaeon]
MRHAKLLAFAALAAAFAGAGLRFLPVPLASSTFALGAGVLLAAAAAWMLGRHPPAQGAPPTFRSELALHASSLVLLVVFMLLALVEVLAIPAAMGKLVVFSAIGIGFIQHYPILTGALLATLTGAILLAAQGPALREMQPRERMLGHVAAGVTALIVAGAVAVAAGA